MGQSKQNASKLFPPKSRYPNATFSFPYCEASYTFSTRKFINDTFPWWLDGPRGVLRWTLPPCGPDGGYTEGGLVHLRGQPPASPRRRAPPGVHEYDQGAMYKVFRTRAHAPVSAERFVCTALALE